MGGSGPNFPSIMPVNSPPLYIRSQLFRILAEVEFEGVVHLASAGRGDALIAIDERTFAFFAFAGNIEAKRNVHAVHLDGSFPLADSRLGRRRKRKYGQAEQQESGECSATRGSH